MKIEVHLIPIAPSDRDVRLASLRRLLLAGARHLACQAQTRSPEEQAKTASQILQSVTGGHNDTEWAT